MLFGLIGVSWSASSVYAQTAPSPDTAPQLVPLWPAATGQEQDSGKAQATMEVYRPFAQARSATVVILPGGGYSRLSPYGRLLAEYFRALGFGAVVVNYRLLPHRHPSPYHDATRALRLLKTHAKEWGLPAEEIILLGESAGGHLAALVATTPAFAPEPADDLAESTPFSIDRLILLYPVILAEGPYAHASIENTLGPAASTQLKKQVSADLRVTSNLPPTLVFHAVDDAVVSVENSLAFARAGWAVKADLELQIFPRGGHGRAFAYDAEISPRWRETVQTWLDRVPKAFRNREADTKSRVR